MAREEPDKGSSEKVMTFTGHLGELRRALVVSSLALLLGMIVGVIFSDFLDELLRAPIAGLLPAGSDQPVFLGIFEPIFYRLKLGLIGGIVLASPVIFQQLWWFIAPALYPRERRLALPFILLATTFFAGGVAFCYLVILPQAAAFAVAQMTDNTRMILSLQSYLSQSAMFLLAFGLVFETPLLVFALCFLGVVKPATLARFRKYVLLGAFIVSAIITPTPDAFNQAIVAVPMYLLFELGVLAGRLAERRRERGEKT